jgi:hypothetical protein
MIYVFLKFEVRPLYEIKRTFQSVFGVGILDTVSLKSNQRRNIRIVEDNVVKGPIC